MIRRKSRKAQGHVEMIISFLIFIGFVTVLLVILNPVKQREVTTAVLDTVEQRFLDNISLNYKLVSLGTSGIGDDFWFEHGGIILSEEVLLVRDANGVIMESDSTTDQIDIEYSDTNFYQLYIGDGFRKYAYPGNPFLKADIINYNLGVIRNEKDIFLPLIENITREYNGNYNSLKNKLDLTGDFEFYVYNGSVNPTNLIFNGTRESPSNVDKVARNIPLVALDENANKIGIVINLIAW